MGAPSSSSRSPSALRRIDRTFPPLVIQELAGIEQALGGRAAVIGMLVLAPLTPDLRYLLGLLGDPQHQTTSLAEICAMGNILPGELLTQLIAAALLKGKAAATQKISAGIAAVAEDIMTRAAPYEDACHACQGVGTITPEPTPTAPNPSPLPCEVCRGTGRLIYRPDLERQKLAIEMAQLLPKSSGIQIAMQQNNARGGGSGGGSLGVLERLQAMTDRILYEGDADAPEAPEPASAAPAEGVVEGEVEGEGLDD